jgi:carbon-monoxide dehydrogenase small subunit
VKEISTRINGEALELEIEPNWTLLYLLREELQMTGTHCGCEMGDCGACTVLMNGKAVPSCLVLAVEADGADLVTVEGLSKNGELDPVQNAFVEAGASQCGFCTPGMVMATKGLLAKNPHPTEDQIRHGLAGNICRCTGYVKIVDAVKSVAEPGGSRS